MIFLIFHTYFDVFGQEDECIKKWDSITHSEVYEVVDVNPEPLLCKNILSKKIRRTIQIDSLPNNVNFVSVQIAFIVCPDGNIIGERILYNNTYDVGSQMLQAIEGIEWNAGLCNNEKVPVLYQLPLRAHLQ